MLDPKAYLSLQRLPPLVRVIADFCVRLADWFGHAWFSFLAMFSQL